MMVLQESRISRYAREQRSRAINAEAVDSLESEVDSVERLNLRLRKELLDETTLRVRSESERNKLKEQIEDLTAEVEEREKLLDERVGRPQRIRKSVAHPKQSEEVPPVPQRVDGSPTSKRGRDVQPFDIASGPDGTRRGDSGTTPKKSSRVRGTVK